jgi:hypothetical protein
VEQILQDFLQPDSGLDIPKAMEQLVGIFGPGSEGVSSKLLDDLAVDPQGGSRVNWDTAVRKAVIHLNELKRSKTVDKEKKKKG